MAEQDNAKAALDAYQEGRWSEAATLFWRAEREEQDPTLRDLWQRRAVSAESAALRELRR